MKKRETNVAKPKKKSSASQKAKLKAAPKKSAAKKVTAQKKTAAKPVSKAASKKAAKPQSAKKAAPKTGSAPAKANSKTAATKKSAPNMSTTGGSKSKSGSANWENFLTPLDDRLIVELASGETMTAGGLYIPATVSDVSGNNKGKVLVAGRGHRDDKGRVRPMDVRSGDTVVFAQYSGSKMNLLGQDVLILRESEILGIVDKK